MTTRLLHRAALLVTTFALAAFSPREARSTPALPGSLPSSLTVYTDRAAFEAANPGLPTEDFEDLVITQFGDCETPSPVNALTNNDCVPLGAIEPGLEIAAVGPTADSPRALVVISPQFNPPLNSQIFGANLADDNNELRFAGGVEAVGFDYVGFLAALTGTAEVYDTAGNLLGTAPLSAQAQTPKSFFGVRSDGARIGRIRLVETEENNFFLDNVAFGGGTGCLQDLSATLDDTTPAPGDIVTFTVTVANTSTDAAALDLWIDATGPVARRVLLASGSLPAGATVTRDVRVRVSESTPPGTYAVDLTIGDFADGDVCDTVPFEVTVSTSAVSRAGVDGSLFESGDVVPLSAPEASTAEASASRVRVAPNPFAQQATIRFAVETPADVRLAVYDVLGREVAVLVDARVEAGTHAATLDARDLAPGTYVYRLVVGTVVQTGRMTLAR
ncbi:MAG: T9SS type A sorting domain-containing protein [Rubricoccaceae bacterium]|nr:T9SS type A sorting domain-containing protein [Rubricoccaceae bacterium]